LLAVYKTFFFDLPLAAMRETFAAANGREAVEAAWKNYDQGIRLATAAIDNLYRDPRFGRVVDRALQGVLRWQQLSSSVSGALLPGRRPTVDLPTAAEVRELLTELRALSSRYSRVPEGAATDGQLPPVNVPRKGANAVPSPEQRSRGYLTADLGDYFEPVDGGGGATAADSPPAPAQWHEYFEPVNYPAGPSPEAKPRRRLVHIHAVRGKTQAVRNPRPRQKRAAALVHATGHDTQPISA
jgi:hypothetical protein